MGTQKWTNYLQTCKMDFTSQLYLREAQSFWGKHPSSLIPADPVGGILSIGEEGNNSYRRRVHNCTHSFGKTRISSRLSRKEGNLHQLVIKIQHPYSSPRSHQMSYLSPLFIFSLPQVTFGGGFSPSGPQFCSFLLHQNSPVWFRHPSNAVAPGVRTRHLITACYSPT